MNDVREPLLPVEPFRPRFPWYGPHLQTIRNPLRPPPILPGGAGAPLRLPLADGDVLSARLDRPSAADPRRPTVLVVHGLGGSETSPYVLAASAFLTSRGFPVVRLSLRGAGPSQPLCRGWSHAGRYADLLEVLPQLPAGAAGLAALGFSLGGNLPSIPGCGRRSASRRRSTWPKPRRRSTGRATASITTICCAG
ncbi:MAG: alpha/beta fold hydrolase [Pseudomonadota bacterium]